MITCSRCGQENPEGARFCNACAAPLAAPEQQLEERKVVTVLFADLVGFTSRAEQMDPEEVRSLLRPYHARLREELERFGGTVEKFIGDAVMAVFGAPITHEDDAERAVRAALAIRDWILDEQAELQLRIGVNSGQALVSLGARPEEGKAWSPATSSTLPRGSSRMRLSTASSSASRPGGPLATRSTTARWSPSRRRARRSRSRRGRRSSPERASASTSRAACARRSSAVAASSTRWPTRSSAHGAHAPHSS